MSSECMRGESEGRCIYCGRGVDRRLIVAIGGILKLWRHVSVCLCRYVCLSVCLPIHYSFCSCNLYFLLNITNFTLLIWSSTFFCFIYLCLISSAPIFAGRGTPSNTSSQTSAISSINNNSPSCTIIERMLQNYYL